MDSQKRKTGVALLSVGSNATLVVLKLVIGIAIGSVSVISEAIHSGVDLLAAVIALVAVRSSGRPADEHHAFGHGKIENVSGTIEAFLIFLAAGWIVFEAIHKLQKPQPIEAAGWGVGVMLLSAAANTFVSRKLFRIGEETDSVALKADAWHLRTDVYTSGGVMAGLSLVWLGGKLLPGAHLNWIDPAAAIIVALLIVKAAYELTMESARDLLDARLPPEEEQWIQEHIARYHPKVRGFHDLRTRKAGSVRFMEIHLLVDSDRTVDEGHRIGVAVRQDILKRFPGAHIIFHVDPCEDDVERLSRVDAGSPSSTASE